MNKYTSIELGILFFILLNSSVSTFVIESFKEFNISEILLSILISFTIGYILLLLIFRSYSDDIKSINKISKYVFIPIIIITSIIFLLGNIYASSSILKDVLLNDTSVQIVMILILLVSFFLAQNGLKTIIIASNLLFIIYLIIIIIIVSFNITNVNSLNLLPLTSKITKNNIYELSILINTPLLLTLIISKKDFLNFKSFKKDIQKTYIIFYIYLALKVLFIIAILSINYYKIINYPEISVFKSINIFNFIDKLEELLVINIFIECFITISITLLYIKELIKSIINIKYIEYSILLIISILILNINYIDKEILLISNIIFILLNFLLHKKRYH